MATQGVVKIGPIHFGDWRLDCSKDPPVQFAPAFLYGYEFKADKVEVEQSYVDRLVNWVKSLFGTQGEAASWAEDAWKQFAGGVDGYAQIVAGASPIVGECKDHRRPVQLQCYLRFIIWYGANAKVESQGADAKQKVQLQFDLTLPGNAAVIDCGSCPCDEPADKKTTLMLFPGLYEGVVQLTAAGWPEFAFIQDGETTVAAPMVAPLGASHDAILTNVAESEVLKPRRKGKAEG